MRVYKGLFLAITVVCLVINTQAQCENKNLTEVCIVGTSHSERSYINADSIMYIFNKTKPDLILVELDSSWFTKDFRLDTIAKPRVKKGLENSTIIDYQISHLVDLRPFDITGRNEFYRSNNYFKRLRALNQAMDDLYEVDGFSAENKSKYEFYHMVNDQFNNVKVDNLHIFNSDVMMTLINVRQKVMYEKRIEIVNSTPVLRQHRDIAQLCYDFWIKRNNAMCNNILQFVEEYKGKRIIVLVGNNHKYFLHNRLINDLSKQKNCVLKEYWEY